MNDIQIEDFIKSLYPEEIKQADILKKLEQLQAKANRRRLPRSNHYAKEDRQACGATDNQIPNKQRSANYMRDIHGII